MKRLGLWFRALLRPSTIESELREEFRHHLEMEVLKNLQAGMSEAEARRKAMVDFGGVERFMEQTRETRATRVLEDIMADISQAWRGLRKAPGFAAITVLTLGIGIGANTAIFSAVNGVLLRPLPYPESDRLVFINSFWTAEGGFDFPDYPVGSPEYFEYRDQSRSLESVAAVSTELITVTGGEGDPEVIASGWVSPSLFTVLRTPPLLGRTLLEEDGGPDPSRVVVLSYDIWQRRFGGDSTVVGRQIQLGMELSEGPVSAEVVGVMPIGFGYPMKNTQLWGPMPLDPARTWRGGHWFNMVGRLGRGVTLESARTEMAGIMSQWELTYPDHHVGHGLQMRSLLEEEVGQARPILFLLLGSVGLVLLIACANVASLLLARGEGRRREVAVRKALGAGKGRILQQSLSESLLLATLGGILGLFLAWAGVRAMVGLEAGAIPRVDEVGLDGRVLLFTGSVVGATTLLFGLLPAMREATEGAANTLRAAGQRATSSVSNVRFRRGLVVAEIALSVLLIVGAGLLVRSFQKLLEEDIGFPTEGLYFARLSLPAADYSPEEATFFFDELVYRTRGISGVTSATTVNRIPLLWSGQDGRFHIEGRPEAPTAPLCCMGDPVSVGDGFFETLGVGLVRGRTFGPGDHDINAAPFVVVDEAAADRWWPDEDPVGQNVRMGSEDAPWMTVVGVVENVSFDGPGVVWPHLYTPHNPTVRTHPFLAHSTHLAVRSSRDLSDVGASVRSIVRELAPGLAIANSYTMDEVLGSAVARPRFIASLLSVFALAALILGSIGVYGVISYGVALRAGEIGIRRALGASGREVLFMVLRQGLSLAVLGLGLGLLGTLAGARILEGFLHEVSPTDPVTLLMAAGGITVVALIASFVPARKASGVDPLEALRAD